jgi:hypothetical protein
MNTTTADRLATDAFELPENLGLATVQPPSPSPAAQPLNPEPALREVLREQFDAVGLTLRREGIVAAGCLLLFSLVLLYQQVTGASVELPFTPKEGIGTAMMALLLPMAVWKGEEPARRGYHHSMPVGHGEHAIARTLAGLAWTLIAVVGFFGWMGLLSLMTGGQVEQVEPWQWVAPFVAATVTYLLGSALTLVSARPWRWLGGGTVAYLFLSAFRGIDGPQLLLDGVDSVLTGHYGLTTLLTGMVRNPVLFEAPMYLTDAGAWLTSVWIWLVAAVAAFLVAAYRQPEG